MLTQLGIEGFEKGLIEILDCFAFIEALKKCSRLDAIERVPCPVEYFDEIELLDMLRRGQLLEQCSDERDVQTPARRPPVEARGVARCLPRPDHPRREQPVEQSLDKGRAEKMIALFFIESDAERIFERGAHRLQRGQFARRVHPRQRIAGVGS